MQTRHISSAAATIGVLTLVVAGCAALVAESASSAATACAPGSVRAVVAGKGVCFRPGQRCHRRHEPVYRRHGFTCSAGKLVRRKPALPAGAAVEATIALGEGLDPVWLAADGDAVWVRGRNALIRVDPGRAAW